MTGRIYRLAITPTFTFFYSILIAQQAKVTGTIYDSYGKPIQRATISLLHSKDSSLVKADLSDEKGAFEIVCKPGSFLLCYSSIGFNTRYSPIFTLEPGQAYVAGPDTLANAAKHLQGVIVTTKKQFIQVKIDKTVLNVQNSITAAGSNALELLQKSPGITVDNNDNISMKGKAGVKIYVDGKMIQLTKEDLAAYLKSINSNDIETIEFITNPGAKYDASGSAGIIHIRFLKNNNLGSNGSMTAGLVQGITPKGNGAASINYRNNRINIFSNVTASIGKNETDIKAPRIQKDTLYDQSLLQLADSRSYNLKAGIDLFLTKQHTIGIMNTSNYTTDEWFSFGNTQIFYNPSHDYIKKLVALNEIPRRRTNINTNLNYRYADTAGTEINFDADYGLYRGRAKSFQPNYYIAKNGNLISEVITYNNTPTDIDIYTAKLDVSTRKWKGNFSYGAKSSYVKTNNTLEFFNEQNGNKIIANDRSYNFIYKENIHALYVSHQRQYSANWAVQAGLRLEQTNSEGILKRADGIHQSDNNVKRHYLDLFPNLVITYNLNRRNTFNVSYSRRIDRPNYQELNPFELKLDELSYVKGNSFLRPQYSHNIELAYTWKKFNTVIGYSHVKDLATQTVDTLRNFTYAYARNIATQQVASLAVSAPLAITKWWNGFINAWANYQAFKGNVNETKIDVGLFAFGAFSQHSFALGKNYSAEVSAWFNGPSALGPTLKAKSMGAVDAGFQKLLFSNRATLKFTVTDIFRTAVPFRAKTDFGGVFLQFWVRRESQTARVTFTYRFGNNKVKAARQRQTGLESETKRIKPN
jgi:iron complex outermembrane recepter protein